MSAPDPRTGMNLLGAADARILVVDDEPTNTTILERLLRQTGYREVVVVNDSRNAIPVYEELRPDIVLLDLHMPGVDGYQLLDQLADPAGAGIRPPVVVLTADSTRAARERALALGAADFLTKPLDHLEVLLRVRSHLATRFLQLELLAQNVDLERLVAERTAALRESLDSLQRTSELRTRLASALVAAQELERRRIAADIHDDSVQAMAAVGIRLELLSRRVRDDATRTELEALRSEIAAALAALRELVFRLTPASLERAGLKEALAEATARLELRGGPTFEIGADLTREPSLETRVVLFRIAQEALLNARRHARAQRVRVRLTDDGDGFRLDVSDDGRGFAMPADHTLPAATGHFGIATMTERAELAGGWLTLRSAPAAGTTVTAWVPDERLDDAGGAMAAGEPGRSDG